MQRGSKPDFFAEIRSMIAENKSMYDIIARNFDREMDNLSSDKNDNKKNEQSDEIDTERFVDWFYRSSEVANYQYFIEIAKAVQKLGYNINLALLPSADEFNSRPSPYVPRP